MYTHVHGTPYNRWIICELYNTRIQNYNRRIILAGFQLSQLRAIRSSLTNECCHDNGTGVRTDWNDSTRWTIAKECQILAVDSLLNLNVIHHQLALRRNTGAPGHGGNGHVDEIDDVLWRSGVDFIIGTTCSTLSSHVLLPCWPPNQGCSRSLPTSKISEIV